MRGHHNPEADRQPATTEDLLRRVIDTAPSLLHTAWPDGNLDFFNQRWLEYLGVPLQEVCGWGWTSSIHPEDVDGIVAKWSACLASGEIFQAEARVRRADGEYRWFLHRKVPLRDERGNIVKWYGSSIDIDDRKHAEERVQQNEKELQQLIDVIPQHIFVAQPDGTRVYVNKVALAYLGWTPEDGQAADLHTLVFGVCHPDDRERVAEECRRGIAGGAPYELEMRILGKDGGYRWFLCQSSPLRDDQGHITRWYHTGTDIHDRKQTEEEVRRQNLALREEIDQASMFEEIVGSSEALRRMLTLVSKVAPTDSTVLITGETGTGKELAARAIHKRSRRAHRAFVAINCAAVPASLIASELFGHEKGAFTGATQRRLGRFELADGGTIFLDEVGDLPAETQIALLRVLQERQLERVGGSQPVPIDVRVIAATNRDLEAAVEIGTFRRDLFYRLNVFPVRMPSLRERSADIPLLVEYLIERYASKAGKKITNIEKATLELLQGYHWPGNVRELQNVVERAVILCDGETFSVDESWLQRELPRRSEHAVPLASLVDREKEMIENALTRSSGRVSGPSGAAARLGIPRSTLESRIRSLNIDKHRFKSV